MTLSLSWERPPPLSGHLPAGFLSWVSAASFPELVCKCDVFVLDSLVLSGGKPTGADIQRDTESKEAPGGWRVWPCYVKYAPAYFPCHPLSAFYLSRKLFPSVSRSLLNCKALSSISFASHFLCYCLKNYIEKDADVMDKRYEYFKYYHAYSGANAVF